MLWVDACSGPGLMLCPTAQKWPSPYSLRSDSSWKGIKNSDNWSLELITTNKQKAVNAGCGLSPMGHKRWGSNGLLDGSAGCGSRDGNGLCNRACLLGGCQCHPWVSVFSSHSRTQQDGTSPSGLSWSTVRTPTWPSGLASSMPIRGFSW